MTRTFLLAALLLGLGAGVVLAQGANKVTAKSPDGKRLATADKTDVQIFDDATGKIVIKIRAHQADVSALAYAPDGKLLASADKDGSVCLIDAATGKLSLKLKAAAGVNKLTFSQDGKTITVAAPGATRKFELATGKEVP
jgi:WD40 repeat protein